MACSALLCPGLKWVLVPGIPQAANEHTSAYGPAALQVWLGSAAAHYAVFVYT